MKKKSNRIFNSSLSQPEKLRMRESLIFKSRIHCFRIVFNGKAEEKSAIYGGLLGRVPAVDNDPTADLTFNFTYGNNAGFLDLDPKTGEIRLSPFVKSNVNLRAKLGLIVSDGKNEVKADMDLAVNHVTRAMLTNSVTVSDTVDVG